MLVNEALDRLRVIGRQHLHELPLALKARDPREPGAEAKNKAEGRLYRLVRAYFRQQQDEIRQRLPLKADLLGDLWWANEERRGQGVFGPFLVNVARMGVDLAANEVSFTLDWSQSDEQARAWAMKHTGELVKDINAQTRKALANAVSDYLSLPGYTLQDLMDALPYSDARALRIAVTEVTRAASQGSLLVAEQIAKQAKGVKLVRKWFTNRDDRVCDICGPLDGKTVAVGEDFGEGVEQPPAHVNCRCWTSVTTEKA